MTPLDIFNPSNLSDASGLTGPAGARTLLTPREASRAVPPCSSSRSSGPPSPPAFPPASSSRATSRSSPPITFILYAASDLLGALVCYPLFVVLRRHARRVRALHWIGTRMLRLAILGTRAPRAAEVQAELGRRGVGPALFRIATVGFGVDVYSAGMVATGLLVPRALGWGSAIAGDLVWFTLLLGTSVAAGAAVDDDRVVALVVLIAMFVIPALARRVFPALR